MIIYNKQNYFEITIKNKTKIYFEVELNLYPENFVAKSSKLLIENIKPKSTKYVTFEYKQPYVPLSYTETLENIRDDANIDILIMGLPFSQGRIISKTYNSIIKRQLFVKVNEEIGVLMPNIEININDDYICATFE